MQLEVAGRIGLGQLGDEDARLRADVAAERLAKAAIGAGRPSLIRLREDRARRRKRVIAELLAAASNRIAGLIHEQRRQRKLATARRFEHVAAVDLASLQIARLARHAELVFGAIVVGLEIGVTQRPVDERGVFRDRRRAIALDRLRPRAEVVLVKAPRDRAVVDGAAARLVAVILHRDRVRARIRVRPPGDGLALDVRAQVLPLEVAQFVMRVEVCGRQTRAALQPNDFHARFAELGRENPPAAPTPMMTTSVFSVAMAHPLRIGACACRPMMGARVNASLLCISSGENSGCAPGKPTRRQPAKSLLPP